MRDLVHKAVGKRGLARLERELAAGKNGQAADAAGNSARPTATGGQAVLFS